MYKKGLYVFFALILTGVIFGTQSAQATSIFPDTDTYSTYTFSLDMEGNGELVTVTRYANVGDNFEWRSETPLEIPILITSFSNEKANLIDVSVGDNSNVNKSVRNYTISPQSDSTYIHDYVIEVSPKSSYSPFLKNQILTISTKTKINQIYSKVGNNNKFVYYIPKNFQYFPNSSFIQSFIIRVNLPNDHYYWEEILDTYPKYDYRTSFGRGESVEWYYKPSSNYMSPIIINFIIHPDPMKLDLDNATMNSLEYAKKADFWGFIALAITIISIPSVIWSSRDFINWIKEKWNNRP